MHPEVKYIGLLTLPCAGITYKSFKYSILIDIVTKLKLISWSAGNYFIIIITTLSKYKIGTSETLRNGTTVNISKANKFNYLSYNKFKKLTHSKFNFNQCRDITTQSLISKSPSISSQTTAICTQQELEQRMAALPRPNGLTESVSNSLPSKTDFGLLPEGNSKIIREVNKLNENNVITERAFDTDVSSVTTPSFSIYNYNPNNQLHSLMLKEFERRPDTAKIYSYLEKNAPELEAKYGSDLFYIRYLELGPDYQENVMNAHSNLNGLPSMDWTYLHTLYKGYKRGEAIQGAFDQKHKTDSSEITIDSIANSIKDISNTLDNIFEHNKITSNLTVNKLDNLTDLFATQNATSLDHSWKLNYLYQLLNTTNSVTDSAQATAISYPSLLLAAFLSMLVAVTMIYLKDKHGIRHIFKLLDTCFWYLFERVGTLFSRDYMKHKIRHRNLSLRNKGQDIENTKDLIESYATKLYTLLQHKDALHQPTRTLLASLKTDTHFTEAVRNLAEQYDKLKLLSKQFRHDLDSLTKLYAHSSVNEGIITYVSNCFVPKTNNIEACVLYLNENCKNVLQQTPALRTLVDNNDIIRFKVMNGVLDKDSFSVEYLSECFQRVDFSNDWKSTPLL